MMACGASGEVVYRFLALSGAPSYLLYASRNGKCATMTGDILRFGRSNGMHCGRVWRCDYKTGTNKYTPPPYRSVM
jgi:hypothetical protein